MQPKPRVSFLFPYRWLNVDKEFLPANLQKQFIKDWGQDSLYELEGIPAYRVIVDIWYKEPVKVELTKTLVEKAFKKFFPIGKCLGVTTEYTQKKSRTMLPVLDFRVYF